jgi:hypothetical protein
MSAEASIFATRYVSGRLNNSEPALAVGLYWMVAIGVTVLLYDHVLTAGEELSLIWFSPAAGLGYRLMFIVNRYLTEAISLYAAYSELFTSNIPSFAHP